MVLFSIIIFLAGLFLGGFLTKKIMHRLISIDNQRELNQKRNQFVEVLTKIKNGESRFKTRLNDTVYIQLNLTGNGPVDIIYLIDKDDIAIFQGTTCLYTSDSVEREIIEQIIKSICLIYNKKINDIIEILGFVFYREEFEKSIGYKIEDLMKNPMFKINTEIKEEEDPLQQEKNFDIDEILDKISEFGLQFLTSEEKQFLDNYSNEKRN
jgi:hypothetical protein